MNIEVVMVKRRLYGLLDHIQRAGIGDEVIIQALNEMADEVGVKTEEQL